MLRTLKKRMSQRFWSKNSRSVFGATAVAVANA
jgi:hypothetical protein